MKVEVRHFKNKNDSELYYEFRWKMLRKPLGKPKGSERDGLEKESIHVMIVENKMIVGVGRIHFVIKNSIKKAQIRYMAIDENFQRRGYGSKLLQVLERIAIQNKINHIFLHAREEALKFYMKNNYIKDRKSHLLFNSIQHWLMYKKI